MEARELETVHAGDQPDAWTDGYWALSCADDGVELTVWPPLGGQPVEAGTIREVVDGLGISDVDWAVADDAVCDPVGAPVLIAPREQTVLVPGRVQIEVSPDKRFAHIRVFSPSGGQPATAQDVHRELSSAGVSSGIDEQAIATAVTKADPLVPVCVARGQAPEHGVDAVVEFGFRTSGDRRPVELEDGRVDYYNLSVVENVESGQRLVTKTPATSGKSGRLVTGEPDPARQGTDIPIVPGANTELSEDGLTLIASASGHVSVEGDNKVAVYPIYEVKGNVDLSTGSISFVGTVHVSGNVTAGTSITARGDVVIGGQVDGATIKASGHITVRRGIQGKARTRLESGGDVSALFIENADLTAGGSVFVREAIMHSRITAGRRVMVEGKKGLIVGGRVRARDEVVAVVAGSPLGTSTEIEVGVDPALRVEYNQGVADLKQMREQLDQARKNVQQYKSRTESGKTLSQIKQQQYLKLLSRQSTLKRQLAELETRVGQLKVELLKSKQGRVRIKNRVYPGVRVTIGLQSLTIGDELGSGEFRVTDGEVRFR